MHFVPRELTRPGRIVSKLQTSIQTGMKTTSGHVEDVKRSITQAVQSIDDRINGLEIKLTQMEGRVMASVAFPLFSLMRC